MRYADLDIDLLRCFATVAGQGGFTAAGSALGLTQSAVSVKLKRLEGLLRRRLIAPPVRGHLRLGVADHFVPQHLVPFLARFARICPDVQLEVEVGRSHELRTACERGPLDVVIGKRRDSETTGTPIWTETLAWVTARDAGAGDARTGEYSARNRLYLGKPFGRDCSRGGGVCNHRIGPLHVDVKPARNAEPAFAGRRGNGDLWGCRRPLRTG
jgi:DNA-binding transcriptional LysR family regulator